jgi:2Fe-2S ferredoxin
MIRVRAIGRDDVARQIEAEDGTTLMAALRGEAALEVAGACGGSCVCATCHVYVAPDWQHRLPPAGVPEQELLGQLLLADARSRLACQIRLSAALDGLAVRIAPEE